MSRRKCVFFDRDGIVNESPDPERYVTRWDNFHFIPEFADALRVVKRRGYEAMIVSNQSAVAKGLVSAEQIDDMHRRLRDFLSRKHQLQLLDIIYCPHNPGECSCRKPQPGMLLKMADKHEIDLSASWMIGDAETDVDAGRLAGCQTIIVGSSSPDSKADVKVPSMKALSSVLDAVLSQQQTVSLVTGGAGFLGSHLCDLLISKGHRVVCMDNLITGNLKNIQQLENQGAFTFIRHDVTKYIEIAGPVHFIFHFASPASPIDYLQLPIQTLKVGALGTHNALGLARAKRSVFVLASTSEVYGDPLVHPQNEAYWGNVNPIGPRGVYDEAKRFAEAMTMAYHRTHGIETKIVRIFNTYGPRMRPHDGRVVPAFIKQALQEKPLSIFGDGSQTRSFCYVSDLIRGIFLLSCSHINEPVNLGNPAEMRVLDFAKKILRMTGSSSKIEYHPLPVDDPKTRQPDISRARSLLQWEPEVTLDEGLKKTIDCFRLLKGKNRLSD